ncbi:ATP-binding protein [Kineococcus sp. LSe6-4]|uniref:ATP-binding protein n=1 Tax=Kineococcus halophytocola TaxID=3234027 RepID=A0ABV4GWT1_9ACTN
MPDDDPTPVPVHDPVPDALAPALARRLATEPADVRRALTVLGEVLAGGDRSPTTANGFVETHLRVPHTALVSERVDLTNTRAVSVGAALADLVELHGAVLGPVEDDEPPTWQRIDLLDEHVSVPTSAAAFFPAGTATDADVVVQLAEHEYEPQPASLRVLSRPGDHAAARTVADALLATARRDKGFYRGRVLHADAHLPLKLKPTALGPGGRGDLVLPAPVWTEIDANVAALTSRADLLRSMGLGTNRGVLLAGPPGVGKSALSRVVARELAGEFTVIIVDAAAASSVLRQVYRETTDLGPCVVVLEDVDLYLGDRKAGARGTALADFLAVLDGTEEYRDVLTLASTNDPSALDAAATRSARFDAVVHLTAPDREACEAILQRLLGPFAGGAVDCAAVAAHLPPGVTGADLREIVRRTVLGHGDELSTDAVLQVVREGRWQPAPLTGNYL